MKVLQFGFDNPKSQYLPHNFKSSNCIAYTGTHDNDTIKGWVYSQDKKTIKFCKKYLNIKKKKRLPWAIVELTWSSVAYIAVAQMQDLLDIGSEGRMNTPSTLGNNWQFRTQKSDFTNELAQKIYELNELYNRLDIPDNEETSEEVSIDDEKPSLNDALKDTSVDTISTVEIHKDILNNTLKEDIPNE